MSHSQLQQLAKNNHKRTKSESSFSSSSYYSSCSSSHQISPKVRTHILLHEYLQTSSTTTTTTKHIKTSKDDHDQDHDHRFDEHNITIPSCFSSFSPRRWSGLKLKCGGALSFMAASQSPVPVSSDIIKKKLSGHQKKAELEREVSMLQKMLIQEEKVHAMLKHVHQRNDGSPICIPTFLPPKMKEVLAELAMVEDEITRLEAQISQLQIGLSNEQEIRKESKSKQWQIQMNNKRGIHERNNMVFESKAMHFISKAMKSDYNLDEFSNIKDKLGGNLRVFGDGGDQKENLFQDKVGIGFQEKMIPRKSGVQKPASPLRDPRQPTPKAQWEVVVGDSLPLMDSDAKMIHQQYSPKSTTSALYTVSFSIHSENYCCSVDDRERDLKVSFDLPPKSTTSLPQISEDHQSSNQNWHPNKLSESIMKCLIFIFVRLLRTSRAVELERSGQVSRPTHTSSISSRSFRVETNSLNSKPSSLILQKDSKQKDPFGIFNSEESIPRDIGPYKNLVIFTSSSLDPKSLSSSSFIPLLQNLRALMNNLQKVDLSFSNHQQKLAFWINMYNACIMHGFLQYGVPSTPEKLLTLMNKATFNIGGNIINAQAIEHFILRKPSSSLVKEIYRRNEKDDKETIVRKLFGLESMDPNIAFALCCGTRSSPAVKIYTSEGVVGELERSKLEYLQASIMVTTTKRIAFPELLLRNMRDFAEDADSLVKWVCHQLPASGSLRKSMVECFRSHNNGKLSTIVEKIPVDFEFQYLLSI